MTDFVQNALVVGSLVLYALETKEKFPTRECIVCDGNQVLQYPRPNPNAIIRFGQHRAVKCSCCHGTGRMLDYESRIQRYKKNGWLPAYIPPIL